MDLTRGQEIRNGRRRAIAPVSRADTHLSELNGFAETASRLLANGYSPLPIMKGTKRPLLRGWSRACEEPLSGDEIAELGRRYPDAGLAVATGYGGLVAVDVDADDPDIARALVKVLGEAAVSRRGSKGFASFYRVRGDAAPFRQFKRVLDVLGHGRNCIIPPSLHPSGIAYRWLTPKTLLDTPLSALPIVGEL